jgi:hypothetical protein
MIRRIKNKRFDQTVIVTIGPTVIFSRRLSIKSCQAILITTTTLFDPDHMWLLPDDSNRMCNLTVGGVVGQPAGDNNCLFARFLEAVAKRI